MAKARKRGTVRLVGLARRTRSALMVSTALQAVVVMVLAVPAGAQPAPNARPAGGVVVGGTAIISRTASSTTINQATQRAAINWQSFNVGSQQSVTFQQPDARAIALNTVTGPNPSQIAGRINANGQVVLVNQSGVTFYKGSQVNTAGLMVSASATDQKAFMGGGKIVFDQPGNPNARIINNGNITIGGAGLASLVAPSVANAGVINATLGHVVLAGAKTATLDLYGDKLVSVNVTGAVTRAPDGSEALVTNTGVIRADGGTVRLTARAVDGVVTNLVTAGGKIQARTVGGQQGQILIDGVGGSITITGNVDATGKAAGTTGGQIELLATGAVIVKRHAVVNASGAAGGGTVAVGTALKRAQGGPGVTGASMAKRVVVQRGATIAANATASGNGGTVTVLSSGTTTMAGLITAKGGPAGGDGGLVEVSGGVLALSGLVDTSAASGKTGTLLLDPSDFYVSDMQPVVATYVVKNSDLPTIAAGQAPDAATVSWVTPTLLAKQKSDISLAATNNLFVSTSNGTTNTLDIGTHNLTLTAGTNLTIDRGFTINAGNVQLAVTAGSIALSGSSGVTAGLISSAQIATLAASSLQATNVTMAAATGIGLADATIGSGASPVTVADLSAGPSGGVTQAAGGAISATTLRSTSGVTGAAILTGTSNAIASLGAFTVGNGFTLTSVASLAVNGVLAATAGDVVLTSTGGPSAIGIGATGTVVVSSANTASFRADKFANSGTVIGGTFEYAPDTAGNLTLGTGGNLVATTGVGSTNVRFGSANGAITATGMTTAGSFDLGVGNAGVARPLDLQATGPVTDGGTSPFQNVTTLTGTVSGGSVSLTANSASIANIGSFTVSGAANNFTVQQPGGTLSVVGVLTAPSVTLGASNLAIPGTITTGGTTSGTVLLTANSGTISGTGVVTAATLRGSASAAVNLPGLNQIASLGSFSASSFTLNNSIPLTVGNTLSAAAVSLTAPSISITGEVTDGGSGTVGLIATIGSINESGTIVAGTISGSSATSAILTGASVAANQIGNLGAFTVTAGSLTVNNGTSLSVSGAVAAAGDIVLRSSGAGSRIRILTTGTLNSLSSGTVSARADRFSLSGAGIVTGGVFEYAQDVAGALTVGIGGAIDDLTGIGTGAVRLGSAQGSVTANSITLATNLDVGTSGVARPLDLQSNGDISDGLNALLNVSTLTGVANTGSVVLGNLLNSATSIGNFTAGAGFTLVDSVNLSVAGVLSAVPVSLTAPSISITGTITTGGSAAGSVSLIASTTTIGGAGVITTGTLAGSAVTTVNLSGANQIGTLGTLTGSATSLNDGVALAINNTVSAAGAVSLTSGGLLTVSSGQTVTGSGVTLTGTSLAISGVVGSAGTVDVVATTGSIGETGTIAAKTLSGSSGGSAILTGASAAANLISNLGAFTATTGTIAINDGTSFNVNGSVAATAGDVVLRSVGVGNTIAIATTGTLAAVASTGTVSVRADAFSVAGAGTVTGGIFEYAQDSPGTLKIGAGGAIANLTGIGTGAVRLGSAAGAITANGLTLTSNLDLLIPHPLDLRSTVSISDGGNEVLNVTTLTGVANAGSVSLGNILNTVTTLGTFVVGTGFGFADSVNLTIANVLSAAPVSLTAPNLTITGTITTGGSAVSSTTLVANTGTISGGGVIATGTLTGGAVSSVNLSGANQIGTLGAFTATALNLNDGVALTIANNVPAAGAVTLTSGGLLTISSGQTVTGTAVSLTGTSVAINGEVTDGGAGTVNLVATAGSVTEPGTLIAGKLTSAGGVAGSATLQGPANQIGTLSGFTAAGSLVVVNSKAMTVAGANGSSAGNVFVTTGTNALAFASAGSIASKAGGTIGILADGLANLGVVGATGIVNAGAAGIFEFAPSTSALSVTLGAAAGPSLITTTGITAGTLRIGAVTLPGSVAPTVNTASIAVGGTFNAASITTLDLEAKGTINQTASTPIINLATLVASTNGVAGDITLGSTLNSIGTIGSIGVTAGNFAFGDTPPSGGVAVKSGQTILANSVSMTILGTLVVNAGGSITAGAAAGTVALATIGPAADLLVPGGQIASKGTTSLTAGRNIVLTGGSVSGGKVAMTAGGLISDSGTVSASAVTLTSANIAIPGVLTDGGAGTVSLIATGGTINETGTLVAGTLSGSSTGAATLTGATSATNQVAALGGFKAAGFTLNDGKSLAVSGVVNGGTGATIADTGAVSVSGTVNAAAVSLTGTSIVISGLATDGGAGTVGLIATAGTINESGTLIAGTLSGSATGAATMTGATATTNQIAALGSFTAAGFTLNDGKSLTVTGVVSGGTSATIVDGGLLSVGGAVTAAAVSLTGTSIAISGDVTDGGAGTVGLVATGGTLNETGTLIAGTLSGSATGTATLTGTTAATNQVATLGSFTAAGFTLRDGASLAVTGVVNGGTNASIADSVALSISGTVSAAAVGLTGTTIAISGTGLVTDGGAGTVGLVATAGSIIDAGTLIAGTLSGSSTGSTALSGATATTNLVATLGSFTAAGFTLRDGASLAVTGVVNGGTDATLLDSASLSISGTVSATAVSLTAANIAITGTGLVTDGGAGTVALVATAGSITDAGTLIAGTLSGSSTAATTLSGATATANQVATLGSFKATGFSLNDGAGLAVTGVVTGGTGATILDSASLSVSGAVSAAAVSLTAANIAISGTVTDGGAGTVGLVATAGSITGAGTLIAGTLSGSSTGATTLSGATATTNQVSTLGSFTAAGFSLNDGASLAVTGVVNGGTAATILDSASLSVSGTVSAAAVGLTAATIAISGTGLVTDGGAGTVGLVATAGSITDAGTLIAGTLSGSSTGATALTGATATTNRVATLGSFVAAGFSLNDGASLAVTGAVSGGASATIVDSAMLSISSGVSAAAVSLTGANIMIASTGLVTDGGTGTVGLIATAGTINEAGTLIAGALSGSSTGTTMLNGASIAANQVATLGSFAAAGFTLNDGASLAVSGVVNRGTSATIVDVASLSVGGTISAAAVSLTGANIAISGLVTDGGAGTVSLIAGGTISETGSLIAGTLSGSSTGATTLTGATAATNKVATLGNFSAAGFTLNDGSNLTVAGTLAAGAVALSGSTIAIPGLVTDGGAGTVSLIAIGGTISETGTLVAGTLSGSSSAATTLASATNQVANIGNFSAAGFTLNDGKSLSVNGVVNGGTAATITDSASLSIVGTVTAAAVSLTAANIAIPGNVTDGGSGTVSLIATGGTINETGTLIAGRLTGSSTGAATLTGATATANQIATVTNFNAGSLLLNDGKSLSLTGLIATGGTVGITDTGALTIPGLITSAAGAVSIGDTGVLTLANTTSIAAATTIGITDLNTMTLAGQLSAPRIVVNNGSGTATILAGTQIQTSGRTRPIGALTVSQLPNSANLTDLGFFMTAGQVIQSGTLTVTGSPSVMRVDASTGIILAPSPGGIVAPKTWLIIGLSNGAKATGGVNVLHLDTVFAGPSTGTTLSGSVGGLSGDAAAGASSIVPGSSSSFRINGCPIASVNCVLLTTQGIPAASPLRDFVIGSSFDPTDEDDLLLPLVSDEVY